MDNTFPLWFAQTENDASPPRFTLVESLVGTEEDAIAVAEKTKQTIKYENTVLKFTIITLLRLVEYLQF